uniref:Uncharacterized protein n=1 Tax=Plectus sambesii TaxID=2011161 RepID=A0A914XGB9_9BILA
MAGAPATIGRPAIDSAPMSRPMNPKGQLIDRRDRTCRRPSSERSRSPSVNHNDHHAPFVRIYNDVQDTDKKFTRMIAIETGCETTQRAAGRSAIDFCPTDSP